MYDRVMDLPFILCVGIPIAMCVAFFGFMVDSWLFHERRERKRFGNLCCPACKAKYGLEVVPQAKALYDEECGIEVRSLYEAAEKEAAEMGLDVDVHIDIHFSDMVSVICPHCRHAQKHRL
jgi:uncharacterized protein YbaR (Trm112 family)